jgi:hypothetical protein
MFTSPELFGYPLHIFQSTGSRVHSFGAASSDGADGSVGTINGTLALAAPDKFWTTEMDRYELSLWSTGGTRLRVLERRPEWFKPWHAWDGRIDVAPPAPRMIAIRQTRGGQLLTLASVPAADWTPVPGRAANREAPPPTARDFERATDTVIELIEPSRGIVVASKRFKQTLVDILNDTLMAGVSTDAAGRAQVDVWTLRRTP